MNIKDLDEELYDLWKVESMLGMYKTFILNEYPQDKDFQDPDIDATQKFKLYAIHAEKYNVLIDASLLMLEKVQCDIARKFNSVE